MKTGIYNTSAYERVFVVYVVWTEMENNENENAGMEWPLHLCSDNKYNSNNTNTQMFWQQTMLT